MRMQKRAVSNLVATVLLILVAVAAVGIIWSAVMPMINKATQYGQSCTNARLSINTESGYTCYNASGAVWADIIRGAEDFTPSAIQVIVAGGGSSKVFKIVNNQATTGVTMISNATTLEIPGVNEEKTYIITSGLTTTSEVAVAPVVKVGNTEKTCDVSSRVALSACRTS